MKTLVLIALLACLVGSVIQAANVPVDEVQAKDLETNAVSDTGYEDSLSEDDAPGDDDDDDDDEEDEEDEDDEENDDDDDGAVEDYDDKEDSAR